MTLTLLYFLILIEFLIVSTLQYLSYVWLLVLLIHIVSRCMIDELLLIPLPWMFSHSMIVAVIGFNLLIFGITIALLGILLSFSEPLIICLFSLLD